jgi:hypothetical protein
MLRGVSKGKTNSRKTKNLRIATLNESRELPGSETRGRVAQVEGVEEVVNLFEVRSNSDDLVDNVLDRDDAVLAEVLLDDRVVVQRDSLLVDLAVTSLVDEFTNSLQVGLTVRWSDG